MWPWIFERVSRLFCASNKHLMDAFSVVGGGLAKLRGSRPSDLEQHELESDSVYVESIIAIGFMVVCGGGWVWKGWSGAGWKTVSARVGFWYMKHELMVTSEITKKCALLFSENTLPGFGHIYASCWGPSRSPTSKEGAKQCFPNIESGYIINTFGCLQTANLFECKLPQQCHCIRKGQRSWFLTS